MMSEPKGRSGKKPKYQIADIGGADLTSEDLSTERVLNFLIKGEMNSLEQTGAPAPGSTEQEVNASSTTPPPSASSTEIPPRPESASTEPPVKKSLSHLFERASSSSGQAKDLKLKLSEPEITKPIPSPPVQAQEQIVAEEVIEAKRVEVSHRVEISAPTPEVQGEPAVKVSTESLSRLTPTNAVEPTSPEARLIGDSPARTVEATPELTHYADLWKNFYRLNSGEIDVLSTMFRMTYDEGRSECYVKMRKLAEMSSLDYRYCQKIIRSLERLGWITKLQDYDPIAQLGVLYRVNLKPSQLI
jgi:hypothetical protein